MHIKLRSFATVALAIFLVACTSTYRSPGLPQGDAAAVLEPTKFKLNAKFFITHIDGQSRGIGWFDRYELSPGRRAITAAVNGGKFKGPSITRYFTAEPGKGYLFVVEDDPKLMRWTFSILEKESGTKVDSALP